ncbi:MAG: hypothetical protein OEY56_10670 [Cyclobacteriaceae bacterium]|nr:hypothetical protein [Cyclobacteriaceae bacterium]
MAVGAVVFWTGAEGHQRLYPARNGAASFFLGEGMGSYDDRTISIVRYSPAWAETWAGKKRYSEVPVARMPDGQSLSLLKGVAFDFQRDRPN